MTKPKQPAGANRNILAGRFRETMRSVPAPITSRPKDVLFVGVGYDTNWSDYLANGPGISGRAQPPAMSLRANRNAGLDARLVKTVVFGFAAA